MSIFQEQAEALQFHLDTLTDLKTLQAREIYSHIDQDTVSMMLEQAARFSDEYLLPLAASGDVEGCSLTDNNVRLPTGTREVYEKWCDLGFPALSLPMADDGLQFPAVIQCAIQEICDAACIAFGMLTINLRCAALTLIKNAPAAIADRFVPGLVSGAIASTIVISEPQAGSDVGRIRTSAKPGDTAGKWLITGTKIWISYGDHDATDQILHLVLARIPDGEPGTRGLGLFAVPKYSNDDCRQDSRNSITVGRLEHKMGLHASPTCVLEFAAATGYLIGEPGAGIQSLFVMMNAMRLAVAVQGSAAANAATLHALNYARERPQGGRPGQPPPMISEHADVKRMLLEMTARSELLRALSLKTAWYLDLAASSADREAALIWGKKADLLLPLAKTLSAETGFELASQGIQVLGGYGYTNDYPLERIARDIRVASIYEGTSGIQARDFLQRKVYRDNGAILKLILTEIGNDLSHCGEDNPIQTVLADALREFSDVTQTLMTQFEQTPQAVEGRAYAYLRLAGHLMCGWCALQLHQAISTDSPYQYRLDQALQLYSQQFQGEFHNWSARALVPMDLEAVSL
ncbi:MAG: acyl-CoA dehydrogenase family protein [Pseudohongiellaceae bacterium]